MTRPPVYLDASALARLVWRAPESDDLADYLAVYSDWVSSQLARVELAGVAHRAGGDEAGARRAEALLERVTLVRVDEPVIALSVGLAGARLGSTGAVHLATALSLGEAPEALVTYDQAVAAAATRHGLRVVRPGGKE